MYCWGGIAHLRQLFSAAVVLQVCLYCCKYVSKADNLLKEATSIVLENTEAKRIQQRKDIIATWHRSATASLCHPSVLDPSRKDTVRVALRLLQNVLNRTSGLRELSSHQLAAQALSIPSCYSSDSFVYIYVSACMTFLFNLKHDDESTAMESVPPAVGKLLQATLGATVTWRVLQFLGTDDSCFASNAVDDTKSYAPRTILKTDFGFVSVDQLRDYYWRPRVLWHYGLDEFVAVFVRRRKVKMTTENNSEEDRYCIPGDDGCVSPLDAIGKYEFDPEYEGHRCFYLQLRSIHVTSLFTSKSPTMADLKSEKGKRRFALFYATLLIPFWPPAKDGSPITVHGCLSAEHYCTYEAFCELMWSWSDPSASFVHRCRYYKLHNLVHSLSTDNSVRKLLHAQKTQYVQRWSSMDKSDPPTAPDPSDHTATNDDDGETGKHADLLLDFHHGPVTDNAVHRREHMAAIKKTLYRLHSSPGSTRPAFDTSVNHGCNWGQDWHSATDAEALRKQLIWLKTARETMVSLQNYTPGSMRASIGHLTASVAVDGECWMIPLATPGTVSTRDTPLTPGLNNRGHFPTRTPSLFYAGQGFVQALGASECTLAFGSGMTAGAVCRDLLGFLNRAPAGSPDRPLVVSAYRLLRSLLDPATIVVTRSLGDAVLRDDLNDQQVTFSDRAVDNVLRGFPTHHILCGGAGAGKSYVMANIEHRLAEMGFRCRGVSYQWRHGKHVFLTTSCLSHPPFSLPHIPSLPLQRRFPDESSLPENVHPCLLALRHRGPVRRRRSRPSMVAR